MDYTKITPCGECCEGCAKKASGFCGGCRETDGHCKEWEQSDGCPIYRCASSHKALFCGLCDDFPCDFLVKRVTWNKQIVQLHNELAKTYRELKKQ